MLSTKSFVAPFEDFFNLIFVNFCPCCNRKLEKYEKVLCTVCLYELPTTNFHKESENIADKNFWGRVHIEAATALFYFNKGSKYQKLIHAIKYQGNKDLGVYLGKLLGGTLKTSNLFNHIDCIVPVPLHPKKEKKRGYNQSMVIALGVSEIINIPIVEHTLIRLVFSDTQTNKTRMERWENVNNIFAITTPEALEDKHVLLVDDVITTGATLEACAMKILEIPNTKVSIAALAIA